MHLLKEGQLHFRLRCGRLQAKAEQKKQPLILTSTALQVVAKHLAKFLAAWLLWTLKALHEDVFPFKTIWNPHDKTAPPSWPTRPLDAEPEYAEAFCHITGRGKFVKSWYHMVVWHRPTFGTVTFISIVMTTQFINDYQLQSGTLH